MAGHDPSGRWRYRFHNLLRAYAREMLAAQEPVADRLAALNRAFGGWLTLADEAGRSMTNSAGAGTFEQGACWRPEESVVKSVAADPAGWFKAEWAALLGTVEQAYAAQSDRLGWALGVRLARIFLAEGNYEDWRAVCELMLTNARRAVNEGREGLVTPRNLGAPPAPGRIEGTLSRLEDTLDCLPELRAGRQPRRCYEKAARCFQQALEALDDFRVPLAGVALVSREPASDARLAALHGAQVRVGRS